MTIHLAASRFGIVLQGKLESRGFRLTRTSGNAPDAPRNHLTCPKGKRGLAMASGTLQYNSSVPSIADCPKEKDVESSLILLAQGQHQENKEKGKRESR